jgi:hypothetical protein
VGLANLAVVTEDFSLYHDLVVRLKRRGVSFASLSPKDPIPEDIGVVITSPEEAERLDFRPLVATHGDLEDAIDQAMKALAGREGAERLAIGVDPGRRIGVAALADGAVVASAGVTSVDEAVNRVRLYLQRHPAKRQVVRIGHGAPTVRDVIIRRLQPLGVPIEVVDETNTTEGVDLPDVQAAISIASARGVRVERVPTIAVRQGEVKDIQRLSRIKSGGRFTIPQALAREVAVGSLTLDEAVRRYKRERQAQGAFDLSREEE